MRDRGMKKWLAYRSLTEAEDVFNRLDYRLNKIEKPRLSEDKAEQINSILANYEKQEVLISYFDDGYIYEIKTIIKRIDTTYKYLLTSDNEKISFKDLVDLKLSEQGE